MGYGGQVGLPNNLSGWVRVWQIDLSTKWVGLGQVRYKWVAKKLGSKLSPLVCLPPYIQVLVNTIASWISLIRSFHIKAHLCWMLLEYKNITLISTLRTFGAVTVIDAKIITSMPPGLLPILYLTVLTWISIVIITKEEGTISRTAKP